MLGSPLQLPKSPAALAIPRVDSCTRAQDPANFEECTRRTMSFIMNTMSVLLAWEDNCEF
eukprot:3757853-Prymnesium_polylepis.1